MHEVEFVLIERELRSKTASPDMSQNLSQIPSNCCSQIAMLPGYSFGDGGVEDFGI